MYNLDLTVPCKWNIITQIGIQSLSMPTVMYRGADRSLAQPGRKQATVTEDFDFCNFHINGCNIMKWTTISSKHTIKFKHADFLFSFWSGSYDI
jgi:hypothetical protein